ncbi:hypothetical protein MKW94_011583 [Papaver nudicaule]|uniref:Uncharacterized protein n=1 Tax=Papaver nudicaule TaxID=74823 RepID=A0AA41VZZ7_PAPNU|nr:hypothetical protein [Papaver nudicaule]
MATLLLPISSQIIFSSQNTNYTTSSNRRYLCVPVPLTNNSKTLPPIRNPQRIIPLCSPSPPSASLEKPESSTEEDLEKKQKLPFRGCQACGKEEVEKGCNGEGRVQGGIATVPGFGWWPIKAYRPCPGFVASGGRYRRRGQSMDEVAWGRTEKEITIKITDEVQSSTNKQSPKRSQG